MRGGYALVGLMTLLAGSLRAQDPDLVQALALQRTMQRTIQQAEPAIACILVSRSERYQEVGQGPDREHPGKLGAFDPSALPRIPNLSTQIETLQKLLDFTHPDYVPRAFGSGVVVDARGLILTNYHVVQDATKVYVRLPGGKGSYADIHAADPRSDLAVLKLLNPNVMPLKTIPLGDADKLERGQFVLTLANPYAAGFRDGQPSASWGILSNIRRRAVSRVKENENVKPFHFYSTLLQTDARLSLGSSGGALVNLQGEMVGLLTSLAAIQGGETPGGFAVPITANMARIINVLKRGEEVDYGFLGVGHEPMVEGRRGVRLSNVDPSFPAGYDARLQRGDLLLAINGQPIKEHDDIFFLIASQLAGATVRLQVQRGPRIFETQATLAKLNVPAKSIASSLGSRPFVRGLRVDYTSIIPVAGTPRGVLVTEVQPGSIADRANVKAGAVITHVNQQPVTAPPSFYQAMPAAGPV